MFKIIFFLLLVFGTACAYAQEQTEPAAAASTETAKQEQTAPEQDKQEQPAEVETPDTFDPTEKVNEDYSVAFPVDI